MAASRGLNLDEEDPFRKKWGVSGYIQDYPCWNELLNVTDGDYRAAILQLEKKFGLHTESICVNNQNRHHYSTSNNPDLRDIEAAMEEFVREEIKIWKNENIAKILIDSIRKYAEKEENKYRYTELLAEISRMQELICTFINFTNNLYSKINSYYKQKKYPFDKVEEAQKLNVEIISPVFEEEKKRVIIDLCKKSSIQTESQKKPAADPVEETNSQILEKPIIKRTENAVDSDDNKTSSKPPAAIVTENAMNPVSNRALFKAIVVNLQKKIFSYFKESEKSSFFTWFFDGRKVALSKAGEEKQYAVVSDQTKLMLDEINRYSVNKGEGNHEAEAAVKSVACVAFVAAKKSKKEESRQFYQKIEQIADPIASLEKIKETIREKTLESGWGLEDHYWSSKIKIGSIEYVVPKYVKMMWDAADGAAVNVSGDARIDQSREVLRNILSIAQVDSQAGIHSFFRRTAIQDFYKNISAHLVIGAEALRVVEGLERECHLNRVNSRGFSKFNIH